MTGQVKEEVLTRWGELGVGIHGGQVRFEPQLLLRSEFAEAPYRFAYVDVQGQDQIADAPSDSLCFTFNQVPVCYVLGSEPSLTVHRADGAVDTLPGCSLSASDSRALFARNGAIRWVQVRVPADRLYHG
jgi:hypothetical protein